MRRRLFRGWGILPLLVFIGVPVLSVGKADSALAIAPINFTRGTVAGAGFATSAPGSLAFGPDGRLYVADTSGRIQERNSETPNQDAMTRMKIAAITRLNAQLPSRRAQSRGPAGRAADRHQSAR